MKIDLLAAFILAGAALLLLSWVAQRVPLLGFLNRRLGKPLSSAESWAIAASANLAAPNGHPLDTLSLPDRRDLRESLKIWWRIHDRADLLDVLRFLGEEGHSAAFEPLHAHLSRLPLTERLAWAATQPPDAAAGCLFLASNLERFKNGRLLAWDRVRLIDLARCGRGLGWLDTADAWSKIFPAARHLQAEYGSWQEMSDNYLAARIWWGGGTKSQEHFARAAERLVNSPASPWQTLPWDTPLG